MEKIFRIILAEVKTVVASTIRSAFEYLGQKCSSVYVPESLWGEINEGLVETQKTLKMRAATEADTFMSACNDRKNFYRISDYTKNAKASHN